MKLVESMSRPTYWQQTFHITETLNATNNVNSQRKDTEDEYIPHVDQSGAL